MVFIKEKAELIKQKFTMLMESAYSRYVPLREKFLFYRDKLVKALPYLTYFPFIGWFYPMFCRKDDRFLMFHAVQGFVMAAFFFSFAVILYFLTALVPSGSGIIKFVIVMIIYAGYFVYFVLAAAGTRFIYKNLKNGIPFFEKIAKRIDI